MYHYQENEFVDLKPSFAGPCMFFVHLCHILLIPNGTTYSISCQKYYSYFSLTFTSAQLLFGDFKD